MRSTTAFVLATLAVGQAAAGHLKHASFHARRQNDAAKDKVEMLELSTSYASRIH
jgi:hypothetical protein